MKVAITGVSGYLGGLVAKALEKDPDVESILGLDIVAPKSPVSKLSFQKVDVRYGNFAKLLAGQDVVYHLAFIVEPPKSLTMADVDDINIEGSRRVFTGAIEAGVQKIIYSSSAAAYGAHPDNPIPMVEDTPLRPNDNWYYSRTKGVVELLLDDLQQKNPETIIIRFRPSIFLGPTINNSVGKSLTGKALVCVNKGLKVDFGWDEDIVDAFCLALGYDSSDTFNLTGNGPLTTHDMGLLLGKPVLHLNPKWVLPLGRLAVRMKLLAPGMLEWLEVAVSGPFVIDTEKARNKLGWKPKYDATQTLVKFARCCELPVKGTGRLMEVD